MFAGSNLYGVCRYCAQLVW